MFKLTRVFMFLSVRVLYSAKQEGTTLAFFSDNCGFPNLLFPGTPWSYHPRRRPFTVHGRALSVFQTVLKSKSGTVSA